MPVEWKPGFRGGSSADAAALIEERAATGASAACIEWWPSDEARPRFYLARSAQTGGVWSGVMFAALPVAVVVIKTGRDKALAFATTTASWSGWGRCCGRRRPSCYHSGGSSRPSRVP